jgi:putative peptidoglycan lipid II flippase
VAALNYANKVVGAVIGVVAAAFATATLPYFSKMAAQGDWSGCRHTVKRYSLLIVITTIPLTLLLMVFARPLITLLFQRGAFSAADAAVVTSVQIAYSLQIPFFVWAMLFVRFLSSIKRNDILMYGSAISLVIDIALNLALMRIWGIVGIALSTSIVYMVSVAFFSFWSLKLLRKAESADDLAVQASSVPE